MIVAHFRHFNIFETRFVSITFPLVSLHNISQVFNLSTHPAVYNHENHAKIITKKKKT